MASDRLKGRTALVTGGGHGIGRSIALAFAREGAELFVTYRQDAIAAGELAREVEALGRRIELYQVDARDAGAAAAVAERAAAFLGRIHVLVNNVGIATRTPFLQLTPAEYDDVLNANLRFPFFVLQNVARHMVEHGVRGSVINVSSVSAYRAVSRMAHYQSSKAGLSMLSRSASYELAEHGIRVNTLSPGLTATNSNRNQWEGDPQLWQSRSADIPLGRPGVSDDHAGAAVFLASDESSWMTGADIVIDGGESAV